LGIRQARYFGGAKTLFQLCIAAAVANLTLLAYRAIEHATTPNPGEPRTLVLVVLVWAALGGLWVLLKSAASPTTPRRAPAHSTCLGRTTAPPYPTSRPDF
jgi:hypothetical protein